jgi:hypothetical protein
MKRNTVLALLGATAIAVMSSGAALAASSAGPAVTVEVKTLTKTLLAPRTVHGEKGWITKGGTPRGACPGKSAAGALDAATHGHWGGKYYSQYNDLLVTSILGVKPKSHGGWWLYVNGKSASVGVCAVKLKPGERLLFKLLK